MTEGKTTDWLNSARRMGVGIDWVWGLCVCGCVCVCVCCEYTEDPVDSCGTTTYKSLVMSFRSDVISDLQCKNESQKWIKLEWSEVMDTGASSQSHLGFVSSHPRSSHGGNSTHNTAGCGIQVLVHHPDPVYAQPMGCVRRGAYGGVAPAVWYRDSGEVDGYRPARGLSPRYSVLLVSFTWWWSRSNVDLLTGGYRVVGGSSRAVVSGHRAVGSGHSSGQWSQSSRQCSWSCIRACSCCVQWRIQGVVVVGVITPPWTCPDTENLYKVCVTGTDHPPLGMWMTSHGQCPRGGASPPLQEILYPRLVFPIILNKLWFVYSEQTCWFLSYSKTVRENPW